MGAVFLGYEVRLDRRVAIKVLLPEVATGAATSRFLREARLIAGLAHPNVVPIHDVGEVDGLFYYVMEYLEGETLAERLTRGPLSSAETASLARDLLHALQAVHAAGAVHRDIKPANVFMLPTRAILTDFGIAKTRAGQDTALTATGGMIGTPVYMPPEQLAGDEVAPQTDIYATGMVLYEALTARRWSVGEDPLRANWFGVPREWKSVLQTALRPEVGRRFPTAAAFRERVGPSPGNRARAGSLAVAGMGLGALIVFLITRPPLNAVPAGGLTVQLAGLEHRGAPELAWVTDSLTARLETALRWVPEFTVIRAGSAATAAVVLSGTVTADETGLTGEVRSDTWDGLRLPVQIPIAGQDWPAVADQLSSNLVRELWSESSPLAPWLPRAALPTPRGFSAWLQAERLAEEGRWDDALAAFHAAVALDSSCVLCSWRITEVERWLDRRPDPYHRRRALDREALFPPHYRRLIRARLALTDRLDSLRLATDLWNDFYYAWFLRGEEEFNRGPLYGQLRADARPALERAALLRPQFAPIWWDLAWLSIAEGDRDGASNALARIPPPRDPHSTAIAALLQVAFSFRFESGAVAARTVEGALSLPDLLQDPRTAAGPRMMPAFDTPSGAVALGAIFERLPRPDLQRSGLVAQMFGAFALGRVELARGLADRLVAAGVDPSFPLFVASWEAVHRLADPDGAVLPASEVIGNLERYAAPDVGNEMTRRRAQWLLDLLSAESRGTDSVPAGSPARPEAALRAVVAARQIAPTRPAEALETLDRLRRWEIADVVPDPFFRTVVHLSRAEWYAKLGNRQAAVEELRWHEAVDQWGLPVGAPNVEEVDWTFATLARWKRASLLDSLGDRTGEVCAALRAVALHWQDGDPTYAARASQAATRLDQLDCPGA